MSRNLIADRLESNVKTGIAIPVLIALMSGETAAIRASGLNDYFDTCTEAGNWLITGSILGTLLVTIMTANYLGNKVIRHLNQK